MLGWAHAQWVFYSVATSELQMVPVTAPRMSNGDEKPTQVRITCRASSARRLVQNMLTVTDFKQSQMQAHVRHKTSPSTSRAMFRDVMLTSLYTPALFRDRHEFLQAESNQSRPWALAWNRHQEHRAGYTSTANVWQTTPKQCLEI